jgi:hypothetical protein
LGIGQEIGVWVMGDNPRLDPIHRNGFPLAARKALHHRRCASAILARPAVVFGPVDSPPWKRQRRLPGSTLTPHGLPWRLRAPHIGRSFRGNGMQLPFKPSAQLAAISAHPAAMVGTGMPTLARVAHPIRADAGPRAKYPIRATFAACCARGERPSTPKRSDQAWRLVRDRKPARLDFPANSRPAPVQP